MAAEFDALLRQHAARARQHAPRGETLSIGWQYPPGLIELSFINMLFRLATLGIYHFWAKTEVRQRIWSAIRINDEPLTYTGRGLELFIGFLIVFGAIILPMAVLYVVLGPVFASVLYIAIGFLFGLAIYRAQRYRLARTRWRGIRGALEGNPQAYAWTFLWTAVLIPFTLSWIMPWRATKLQSMITNNIRFGDERLRFDARSGPLYGPFAVAWIGGIASYVMVIAVLSGLYFEKLQRLKVTGLPFVPTAREIGITVATLILAGVIYALAAAWYRACTINHFAYHTHIGTARFNGNLTAVGLIWISVTNYLIMMAGALCVGLVILAIALPTIYFQDPSSVAGDSTAKLMVYLIPLAFVLGPALLAPIIQARSTGYLVRNLSISGTLPIDEIVQTAGADVRYGEGLAEAFDIDAV